MDITTLAFLVPIVVALVEVCKQIGLSSRYAAVASLVFGLSGALLVGAPTLAGVILGGLIVGLTASGLYSGTRATLNV